MNCFVFYNRRIIIYDIKDSEINYSRKRLHTKTCTFSIEICSEFEKIMSYLGGNTDAEHLCIEN